MKLTHRLLRQLINEEMNQLTEKAVSSSSAKKQGLALYIGNQIQSRTHYMLYEPAGFIDIIDKIRPAHSIAQAFLPYIHAIMITDSSKTGKAWNASEILIAAANPGFGPLIYDIAMVTEDGLMSDRDSVSLEAKRIWTYYKNQRSDVEAKLLDDVDHPLTPEEVDDAIYHEGLSENPLNYAYFATKKINVVKLTQRNSDVIKVMQQKHDKISDRTINLFFATCVSKFFNSKYS